MRDHKGTTTLKAHCKVCGQLSPTAIHSENGVLKMIHIKCEKHHDNHLNQIEFKGEPYKNKMGAVEYHGY